jgi:hypothetical protein
MIACKERHFSDLSPAGLFLNRASTAARPVSWKWCQNDGAKEGSEKLTLRLGRPAQKHSLEVEGTRVQAVKT